MPIKDKNQWGSNLSFLFAMIGSAVGLGNIWRYPFVLYENGGGAFYIPYIMAILLMGVPFLILEYGVGYNFKSSFAKALTKINPKLQYFGWFLPVVVFVILIYYSTILGWDGIYFVLSFFKGWGSNPNIYFSTELLHSTDSFSGFLTFIPAVALSAIVGWTILWLISHRDLEGGLGKLSKILVPLLFIIMVIIVAFSLTLPGASIGFAELFDPDWLLLWDFNIWMAAFAQIIFSLSLGMIISFTYASYTQDDTDLISNSLIVAFANCLFENFAALGVFSILGYMSLQSGTAVPNLVEAGTGLVFVVYPTVFNVLGEVGYILGPLFFFTVYLAGLTSMLALFEPLSFSIQNKFNLTRSKTASFLSLVGLSGAMFFATAYGMELVNVVDTFSNQIVLLIGIVMECIIFAWIFDAKKLIHSLNSRSKSIKLGKWWLTVVKYLLPFIIIVIWIGGMWDIINTQLLEQMILTVIIAIIVLVVALIFTIIPSKSKDWDKTEERT